MRKSTRLLLNFGSCWALVTCPPWTTLPSGEGAAKTKASPFPSRTSPGEAGRREKAGSPGQKIPAFPAFRCFPTAESQRKCKGAWT